MDGPFLPLNMEVLWEPDKKAEQKLSAYLTYLVTVLTLFLTEEDEHSGVDLPTTAAAALEAKKPRTMGENFILIMV